MKRRSDHPSSWEDEFNKIVGLGNKSIHKSYYPELKDKLLKLDQQSLYYQSIINSIPDAVVVTDQKGLIKQFNPALSKIFGYFAEDLDGKHISILYSSATNDENHIGELPKGNKQHYRCKDGSLLIGEALGSEIKDSTGEIFGHLQVIRDITEREESLAKQKNLEKQLLKSQKMEAIGSMAGGIAHDFNNILSGIIGYAELVEIFEINDVSEIKKNLKEILGAAYRARDLVKQILLFSRDSDHDVAPTKLSAVLGEALKLIRPSTPKSIQIVEKVEIDNDIILADSTQIHQVIINLMTNSIYAMRENGGTLTVKLQEVSLERNPVGIDSVDLTSKMVMLEIKDSGVGIPNEVLDHVFEPYFTTKNRGEGTGFGLALVHGIVKSHKGYIEVESTVGLGTCFRIYLPQKDEVFVEKAFSEELPLTLGSGHIMLVDDEISQLKWGREFLVRLGYTVSAYDSGEEALQRFKESPLVFDIVITDQTMPGMPGSELVRLIRLLNTDIPVIMCTGFSKSLSRDFVKETGITKVLNKPYSLTSLAETLENILV